MVKVPGTPEGIPAIRQLLEDGLNINITLLFAQSAYEQVAEAYPGGSRGARAQGSGHQPLCERGQFLRQPHRHAGRFQG